MARQVNYYKVVSLPASLQPSSFYFAKGAVDTEFKMYLTSDSATPAAIPLDAVPNARTITAGTGLSGGGDLSSNKTISLNLAYTDARYSRLDFDNTFTKHNHFDNAISIPSIAPTGVHGARTYIHFGDIGQGGFTPPVVANLTDLQDVAITPAQQATDGVVSWSTAQGKFVIGTAIGAYIPMAQKGTANGVATLGADGLIPSGQLPSYVDDVVEVATFATLPATGEAGKIYVVTTAGTQGGAAFPANSQFRWTGSAYVRLVASPGTTDNVVEGTSNLYFTTARARAAISVGSGLSYTDSTGVLSVNRSVTDGWYEASFAKNSAFNKNFGTAAGTVAEGNHTHTFASLTSKPTTVAGYGIADAFTKTESDARFGVLSLNNIWSGANQFNNVTKIFGAQIEGASNFIIETSHFNNITRDFIRMVNGNAGAVFTVNHYGDVFSNRYYSTPVDAVSGDQLPRLNQTNTLYGRKAVNNDWTAHNHFDAAISIPAVAPTGAHANKTYIHFGAVGTGGSTPPLVANLSDLQDVAITGATTGQVLQWNGTAWINSTVPLDLSGYVQKSTQVIAGTGLTGGGTLTQDRTLSADFGTTAGKVMQGNWRPAWGDVTGKPTTFSPSAHTHTFDSLTAKPTTLAGYGITNGEPSFSKNTGFNKNFGTTAGTVSEGNHTHTFASLTAKPTTLSGYGITDGYTKTELDGRYLQLSGGVMTGLIIAPSDATLGGHLPRLSQVTTLITNATSWSQEAW